MDMLKQKFFEKASAQKTEMKSLLKQHGFRVVGEVTLSQTFGGMRGVKSLVWDASNLDAKEGIRFRGYNIPQLREVLPKVEGCKEPLPEGLFWLMLVGEVPTKEEVQWLSDEWKKRSSIPEHTFKALDALSPETHPMTQFSMAILSMQTESVFAKRYAEGIYGLPPINLRDLIDFRSKKLKGSIEISEVEPIQNILKRFGSGSMSHGALSKEAHETLAIGMNRIKGASCSGEGGEDESRFKVLENGDSANSRVKQIASARFGVTVSYLNNCNEIEIKIAQGAKPGEGGQLPGFKVTDEIAKLRYSTPGVTLISPPPHHDIYSIEDLAQLIYDLKQINPKARIGVKLVASSGVGTIAAGVAKAKADIILISGHNGGTGATPQTSVKYVGIPWEMGLTEANQVLTLNNLRHKVTLRTDGGIKTGRDVVIAAMMGAEEYGVATTALVAMGCIMVRQCHSNTCPVGVCTQDEKLREKFSGTPEKVVNLFKFIAEEVREILAQIGFKSLNEIIGRTDLLRQVSKASPNLDDLDLNPLFVQTDAGENTRYCTVPEINSVPDTLDQEILPEIKEQIGKVKIIEKEYIIKNTHRTVGTRISNHLYEKYGSEKLEDGFLSLKFKGSAGQSFGAFGIKGLKLILKGDANDYVGKGLSGATVVVKLPDESNLVSHENTIIGNTVLYGATSGKLFAAGQAGERYAVRNSGSISVIEGCDSNACEYMTGGTVVVLGDVGDNFGAGMTGGMAFIYDQKNDFENAIQSFEKVDVYPIDPSISGMAVYWIADSYYRLKKYDKAIEFYKRFGLLPLTTAPELKLGASCTCFS